MIIGFDAKRAFHNQTGLGNYSRTLISGLMRQYPQHQYALFDTGNPLDLPYFQRQLRESGASWEVISGGWLGKNSRVWGWGSLALKKQLDIFHGLSNEIPLDWKKGKTKVVVTVHDVIFKRFPEGYKSLDRWIYQKKTAFATRHADLIVATSEQTKRDLEAWFPQSVGKIEVVYQDTDAGFHYRKRPEAIARILYQYDLVERPYILCVSKLEKRKNHKNLLEAYKKVMAEIPEDLVLIGGRGDAASEILDKLGDFGGRLRWLGRIESDDLVNLYDGASFCVYPSVFEGFGIPLLEAMRRGKAQISSLGSCFEEVAGSAAIYADSENPISIGEALKSVSLDPRVKSRLELAAQKEIERFDIHQQLEKMMCLYKRLVNEN